eukprot:403359103
MYNGFAKSRDNFSQNLNIQRQKLSPLRFRNQELSSLKNRMLGHKSEQRRRNFLEQTLPTTTDILALNTGQDLIASKLNKMSFRPERDRSREISDNEFKTTTFEKVQERTERIHQENLRTLLFEKYRQKDQAFKLREDDKTITSRIGVRMNCSNENERITSVLQSRSLNKRGESQDRNVNNQKLKQASPQSNGSPRNQKYQLIKNILDTSNIVSNRQYENFEKLQKLNQTLQKSNNLQDSNLNRSIGKSGMHNTFNTFASDLLKTQQNFAIKNSDQHDSLRRQLTNNSTQGFDTNSKDNQSTIESIINLQRYSPKKEQIIMEFADDDIDQNNDIEVKTLDIEQTLRNIKKPSDLHKYLDSSKLSSPLKQYQDSSERNKSQRVTSTAKYSQSLYNMENRSRLKTMIQDQWQKHVNQTTHNFFDKNKIYMVSMQESDHFKTFKQQQVREMLIKKNLHNHKRVKSVVNSSGKSSSMVVGKRLFNLYQAPILANPALIARFSSFQQYQAQQINFNIDHLYEQQVIYKQPSEMQQEFAMSPFDSHNEIDMPFNGELSNDKELQMKGRNSKVPKKSNHGARPCSSVMRKLKRVHHFKFMKTK